jgi:hypothetical protein
MLVRLRSTPVCKRSIARKSTVFEEDVEHAVFFFSLEAAFFFGAEEGLLERFEGFVGLVAESGFVNHSVISVNPNEYSSVLGDGRCDGHSLMLWFVLEVVWLVLLLML